MAVVGHAHPASSRPARQLARLNTTRATCTRVVELAERLIATDAAGLDTCVFITSGTEAIDLAWRMATA